MTSRPAPVRRPWFPFLRALARHGLLPRRRRGGGVRSLADAESID